jgi:hypothetical protein
MRAGRQKNEVVARGFSGQSDQKNGDGQAAAENNWPDLPDTFEIGNQPDTKLKPNPRLRRPGLPASASEQQPFVPIF